MAGMLSQIKRASPYTSIFIIVALTSFAFYTRRGSWDYYGYLDHYNCAIYSLCSNTDFEKSFKYLSFIFHEINKQNGFELVFIFYALSSIALKIKIIEKKSAFFGVALFSFLCQGYYTHDLTQIRASLAIALCWYAYLKYLNNQKIYSLLVILIATFIHNSALLSLICLALRKLKPKTLYIFIIPSALIGLIIENNLINIPLTGLERLDIYFSAMGSKALIASQFNAYLLTLLFFAILAIKTGFDKFNSFELIGLNSMVFGICLYLVFYNIPIVTLRVFEFLSALYPFIVARIYLVSNSKFLRLFIIVACAALFLNSSVRNNTRMDMVFPWQKINFDYMSEIQRIQFNELGQD
jgi:hypothetical protein